MDQQQESPRFEQFEGFDALITMLDEIYCRPRRTESRSRTRPIIACVQPRLHEDPGLLRSIADRLTSRDGRRHVPYAVVSCGPDPAPTHPADRDLVPLTPADVVAVRGILVDAANQLARDQGGAYRFPRFRLVTWSMAQTFEGNPETEQRLRELRVRLRERALWSIAVPEGVVSEALPIWLRLLGVLLTPFYFRARQSGRIPGFGRRYRWFLRQPNMAPGQFRSFVGMAERLTEGEWQTENPEQVLRLMVNAFLEDLRESFRGGGWTRRYRTTCPVVLLDGITRTNGGYALLRTVSAVRNETGSFDPLLLVTTSTRVPPLAENPQPAPDAQGRPAAAAPAALAEWRKGMLQRRRKRDVRAWIVIVNIPGRAEKPVIPPQRITLRRPSRPALRTRRASILVVSTILILASGSYWQAGMAHSASTCGDGFTWLGVESTASDVRRVDGDVCIGVTDGSNPHVLPDVEVFDEVRTTILRQNNAALELREDQPERPFVTLVFLGSLTAPSTSGSDVLTAEREQLAGMAVAQAVQLTKPEQQYEPIVRVLIANAGPGMRHGTEVAQQLGAMARTDPSIVAVVGLSESRQTTADTIAALGAAGLPTVSATLSADSLVEESKLYFQIAPQNRREADVAAAYADQLVTAGRVERPLTRQARIYLSDDAEDLYSQNLAADFTASFGSRGFDVETVTFTPGGTSQGAAAGDRHVSDAVVAGRDACDFDGVVLYAARGLPDYPAFVNGVSNRCRDRPPYILANDDVTRYVADRNISSTNTAVPFEYLSFATAPELLSTPPSESSDFYARLNSMFPYEQTSDRGRSLDGHAALNHDAAYTAILAVSYLARDGVAIDGGTVWSALMSVTDAAGAQRRYLGVTGPIDFGGTVGRRVPIDKPITVIRFTGGGPTAQDNIVCAGRGDPLTQPWCPFDS
ncbi:hypothetical protein GCM10010464_03600 [Pseudonocardia yunnanensis]